MLRQDDMLKSQLVLIGWRNALEYGGHLGALMIMGCVMNRVRAGWGNLFDVIEGIPRFAAQEILPNSDKFPPIWEPSFIRLLHEVEGVFDGSGIDYSKGGLYWADLRKVDREWFKEKILCCPDQHPRVADMNSLTVFR
jgi:hypothetical protein